MDDVQIRLGNQKESGGHARDPPTSGVFDSLLFEAVSSIWDPSNHPTESAWTKAIAESDVRIQWDPDHDPFGNKLDRRAIQIGMRGAVLEKYGRREALEIIDVSEFVASQRALLLSEGVSSLVTPTESAYYPADPSVAVHVGLAD